METGRDAVFRALVVSAEIRTDHKAVEAELRERERAGARTDDVIRAQLTAKYTYSEPLPTLDGGAGVPGSRGHTCCRPARNSVLIAKVDVVRPAWWCYPERCQNGHEWGPARVIVSWQRCYCSGAQTLHQDRAIWGHFTVACREPGCGSVWYDPPHEPGPGR